MPSYAFDPLFWLMRIQGVVHLFLDLAIDRWGVQDEAAQRTTTVAMMARVGWIQNNENTQIHQHVRPRHHDTASQLKLTTLILHTYIHISKPRFRPPFYIASFDSFRIHTDLVDYLYFSQIVSTYLPTLQFYLATLHPPYLQLSKKDHTNRQKHIHTNMFISTLATLAAFAPLLTKAQVTATGTNGPTNPAAPTFAAVGSKVDQESMSRLISLNSVSRQAEGMAIAWSCHRTWTEKSNLIFLSPPLLLVRAQVNDFCLFGPPKDDNSEIGNIEGEVVAYCSQPRNGARIIPDGALKSAHVSVYMH